MRTTCFPCKVLQPYGLHWLESFTLCFSSIRFFGNHRNQYLNNFCDAIRNELLNSNFATSLFWDQFNLYRVFDELFPTSCFRQVVWLFCIPIIVSDYGRFQDKKSKDSASAHFLCISVNFRRSIFICSWIVKTRSWQDFQVRHKFPWSWKSRWLSCWNICIAQFIKSSKFGWKNWLPTETDHGNVSKLLPLSGKNSKITGIIMPDHFQSPRFPKILAVLARYHMHLGKADKVKFAWYSC